MSDILTAVVLTEVHAEILEEDWRKLNTLLFEEEEEENTLKKK